MGVPLNLLLLDDSIADAELVLRELRRAGYVPACTRVETEADFLAHLDADLDLILTDYALPQFDALGALAHMATRGLDVPFILVADTAGEDVALEALRHGADDYLLKDRLGRLGDAVRRALERRRLRRDHLATEAAMRQREADLAEAQRLAHLGSWVWHLPSNEVTWSDELFRVFGLEPGALSVTYDAFLDRVHPDDRVRVHETVARTLATGEPFEYEALIIRADGQERTIHARGAIVVNGDGRTVAARGTCQDVTERAAAETALTQERDLLRLVMDSLPDQVFVKDADSRFLRINRAGAAVLGLFDPDEAVGKSDADFVPESLAAAFVADDRRVMATGRPLLDHTETMVAGDGRTKWIATTKAPTFDAAGNVTGIVGVSRDISERMVLEEQLAHHAFHDPLTDLPNRTLFTDRLEHALARTARSAGPLAVLFVDLDGFKVVNDTLGHEAGDHLLVAVADRLRACVRGGDTVARLGGDEFGVLLEDIDAVRAADAAERIAQRLAIPVEVGKHVLTVAASIGIACKTSPLDRGPDLLRRADLAMYAAKQRGKAQHALFDAGMQSRAWERLELEGDLRRALERGEFRVVYQPIVELATGRTVEAEALVRWEHPHRGSMSPAEFIPIAEETGLILPLGWWVLTEACRQARAWQLARPHEPALPVSVNLSPRMFQHPGLVNEVARILAATGLEAAGLKLEITEGVMIEDGDAAVDTLRRLRGLGVRIAVDDFGTGYSSLTYLQRLPIDVLKVDRSFVARMAEDAESLEIVRLIVGLAKTLGMAVVGEGIETTAQAALLRDIGADHGQGFLFARPGSAEAIAGLVSSQSHVIGGPEGRSDWYLARVD